MRLLYYEDELSNVGSLFMEQTRLTRAWKLGHSPLPCRPRSTVSVLPNTLTWVCPLAPCASRELYLPVWYFRGTIGRVLQVMERRCAFVHQICILDGEPQAEELFGVLNKRVKEATVM